MERVNSFTDVVMGYIVDYGPKLLLALLTLLVGLWIIRSVIKGIGRMLEKREVDPSLRSFVTWGTSILLKISLIVSVIGMIGVGMTSFVAIIGAAGQAIGLSLSGSLQNYSGGVMILLFRPFITLKPGGTAEQ